MCNLNILFKVPKNDGVNVLSFMQSVSAYSYQSNSDGDGVFFNTGLLDKSFKPIKYGKYLEECTASNTIIAHQRIATSGYTEDNVQPFESNGFVIAHNGIMNTFAEGGKSDTRVMFKKFNKLFNKLYSGKNRDKVILTCLRQLLNPITYGSYSIVLYDSQTGSSYYFKNSGRSIYWHENKNYIFLTTSASNDKYLDHLNGSFTTYTAKDYTVYKITPLKTKIKCEEIGDVGITKKAKPKKVKTKKGKFDFTDHHKHFKEIVVSYGFTPINNRKSVPEKLRFYITKDKDWRFVPIKEEEVCNFCKNHTVLLDAEFMVPICKDCALDDYMEDCKNQYEDKEEEMEEAEEETAEDYLKSSSIL